MLEQHFSRNKIKKLFKISCNNLYNSNCLFMVSSIYCLLVKCVTVSTDKFILIYRNIKKVLISFINSFHSMALLLYLLTGLYEIYYKRQNVNVTCVINKHYISNSMYMKQNWLIFSKPFLKVENIYLLYC